MEDFEERINRILSDNRSGSKAILDQTMTTILNIRNWENSGVLGKLKDNLLKVLDKHANLVVLFHFINLCFLKIEKSGDPKVIRKIIADYRNKWNTASRDACKHLLKELDLSEKSILLHSNSSSIQELFELIPKNKNLPQIYQTVSGPVNEGRQQAESLDEMGYHVELIHENAIENFIRKIDLAIFGADLISEQFFVNKAGTFPLMLAFNQFKKPVYLLADSRKIINVSQLPEILKNKLTVENNKPAKELWDHHPGQVQVVNLYFDKTPVELLSRIYLENGAFSPDKIPVIQDDIKITNEILEYFK